MGAPNPSRVPRVPRVLRWADRAVIAAIGAFGLAVWWPTRTLPYHWDSATFVVDAARDLRSTGFHPLIATHSDFAHPPLFVALVALAWTIFGESRVVAHALVLPALPALMLATYQLGCRSGDRAVGACAAFLLGGVAVVLEEVGQVYMDLPIAALLAWGLLAWVSDRRAWASALFCAAALMKIPAPLTVPGALALVVAATPATRKDLRAYAALAAPFAVDAVWLAYHAAVTGWVIWRPGRSVPAPHGLIDRVEVLGKVCQWLLLGQWRWVLLVAAVVAMVRPHPPGPLPRTQGRGNVIPRLSLHVPAALLRGAEGQGGGVLLAPLALGLLFFASVGEFGLRYGIYLLPPYFVACLAVVRGALGPRGGVWLGGGSAVLFAVFATTWHPKAELTSSYVFRPDENLAYLDMIKIGRASARWLESKHPDAEIYGAGPEAYELVEPWQGYVTRPLKYGRCVDFEPHAGTEQLVIVHGYHPQQPLCRRLVDATGAQGLARFESNGKWLEVYAVR